MTQGTSAIAAPISMLSERFAPLAGRTALSSIFLLSGITKIQNYSATQGYMEALGVPGALLPAVIAFEIVAPIAVIVGWHARIAAFFLAGFSLLTALIFHFDFADQIQSIMFMKNVAIAGGFLLLMANGPGPFSISKR
jgi:putative oxidoreductase